jgi:DNA primase
MTDLERLKQRHPIEEVMAARGVQLQRRGDRFVARCPFHDEEHPSLVVYPATRSFFCFGCRAAGDVIDFVRRREGLSFGDAVALLSEKGDATSAQSVRPSDVTAGDRRILQLAGDLYHETLLHDVHALRYLEQRGISMDVARSCRLGSSQGHFLRTRLQQRHLSVTRATRIGLLRRDGRDTLSGRIVIPELRGGQCRWMVGRVLDERGLKYLGVALPKPILGYERVRGQARVFVTEGAFDYLTSVGWNLPICALLGTHVRRERLLFLERAREVVLVFDNDAAGQAVAAELAAWLGPRARRLRLPQDVKDLNELGKQPDGRRTFFRLLREPHQTGTEDDSVTRLHSHRCSTRWSPRRVMTSRSVARGHSLRDWPVLMA